MGENAQQDPEVAVDGIQASLDELIKAADATEVVKAYGGVALDQYGHHDERGDTQGGYADTGDVGSLDSMMIGKMQQALGDAGYSVDQIAAFMTAFQEEEEEEEEDETGKMAGKPADSSGGVGTNPRVKPSGGDAGPVNLSRSGDGPGEPVRKAMDEFRADPDLGDAMDVSPFLEALTARTAENLDDIRKSLSETNEHQAQVDRATAAATYEIGMLVKGIAQIVDALDDRLGLIERQPMPQRGHTQLSGAQPMAKGFGAHGQEGVGEEQLTKGEVLATLSYMNLEKGISEIGGQATSELVGQYEGGNVLNQQTFDAVQGFLAAHPSEAATARSYR